MHMHRNRTSVLELAVVRENGEGARVLGGRGDGTVLERVRVVGARAGREARDRAGAGGPPRPLDLLVRVAGISKVRKGARLWREPASRDLPLHGDHGRPRDQPSRGPR